MALDICLTLPHFKLSSVSYYIPRSPSNNELTKEANCCSALMVLYSPDYVLYGSVIDM